jgi:asparagine synthase (glutamine-hydrolysing)
MCGIAGWFEKAPITSADEKTLRNMVQSIRHRGPDGEGRLLSGQARLGHCRLAIIDPEGGAQPMRLENGISITYNGEIYNYEALRDELSRSGIRFRTHSDTEVILHGYAQFGHEFFNRLRGMFAFAIRDERSNQSLLVRDPLGIKPLFMRQDGDRLAFASEAKALLALPGVKAALDISSLHLLLNFRYLPNERTLFEGTRQLQPGEVLQWENGDVRTIAFLTRKPRDISANPEEPAVIDVLRDSLRHHLVADVPIGCYLSGGLDSATLAALCMESGYRPDTFTLATGDDPNESRYAAETARHLQLNNHSIELEAIDINRLKKLLHHLETPKINAIQSEAIARLAAGSTKVVLSGLGGDELFLGYNAHAVFNRTTGISPILPTAFARNLRNLLALIPNPPFREVQRGMDMLTSGNDFALAYARLRNIWDMPKLRQWLYGPRMLAATLPDAVDVVREKWQENVSPLEAMRRYEWNTKMVNDLLWHEDRLSMMHGLESRVPFVDKYVDAEISSWPAEYWMPDNKPKSRFRQHLRGLLPLMITGRPKSGFQLDAPDYFQRFLEPIADHWLNENRLQKSGLFNPATVKQLRNLPNAKRFRWHYFLLTMILMTEIWLDEFLDEH